MSSYLGRLYFSAWESYQKQTAVHYSYHKVSAQNRCNLISPQLSYISFASSHQSASHYSLQNALHRLHQRDSYWMCLLVLSLTNIVALRCCMLLYGSLYSMVFIVVNGSPVFSCNGLESSRVPGLNRCRYETPVCLILPEGEWCNCGVW